MKTIQVYDKAIVLILTKHEAGTLKMKIKEPTGRRLSNVMEKVEEKLAVAIEDTNEKNTPPKP